MRSSIVLVSLLLSCFALPAWSEKPASPQPGGMPPSGGGMPEPPPQAYADCKGKKEGDKVQVTTPDGRKLSMVCSQSQKGLFARPDGPMPPGGGGKPGQMGQQGQPPGQQGQGGRPPGQQGQSGPGEPPPQAYQDCSGKKEGDKVTITLGGGNKIAAICTTSAKGLFARPEKIPGPPGGR